MHRAAFANTYMQRCSGACERSQLSAKLVPGGTWCDLGGAQKPPKKCHTFWDCEQPRKPHFIHAKFVVNGRAYVMPNTETVAITFSERNAIELS